MLESSKDIFWIALAFAALWISIFTGWTIYYVAMMLRDMRAITHSFRRKISLIEQILETFKKKIDGSANYLPPLVDGITRLVEHLKEKKEKTKKKK